VKPARDTLSLLAQSSERRSAVAGTLLVTYEAEGKGATAPAVLLVEWPDKLRLELQDPLGGLLALLVLNGDRFWLFEQGRPELLTGPVRKLPFGLVPRLSAAELVGVFLARPDLGLLRGGKLSEGRSEFPGGAATWNGEGDLLAWSRSTGAGHFLEADYEDYEARSGVRYPTKIRLAGPGPGGLHRRILLAWKDWDTIVPNGENAFRIPQAKAFGRKIKALP
jgi:hypothetical protein